jgi:tetratricopeptide (TPR) repeat protein
VSHDPDSVLRPLRAVEVDVDALRASPARAGAVVRIARAAETALRRMLRDDPTAPVDLRLRALSADDLPTDALLAELRRRDRLPMELAAAFHELSATAHRLAGEGGEAAARDGELALQVADALERHVRSTPADAALEDPVLSPEETLIPPAPEDHGRVHPVPRDSGARSAWPFVAGAAGAVVLALLAFLLLRGGDSGALAEGEAAYARGDTVRAVALFRRAAEEEPKAPRPRYYLAQIYRQSGRRADAARELRTGLEAAPKDAGLKVEYGYLLLESGRYGDAVEQLREAVLLDSTSTRAWSGLVRALRDSGRPAEAERVLARAPEEVRALIGTPASAAPPALPPPVVDSMTLVP